LSREMPADARIHPSRDSPSPTEKLYRTHNGEGEKETRRGEKSLASRYLHDGREKTTEGEVKQKRGQIGGRGLSQVDLKNKGSMPTLAAINREKSEEEKKINQEK